MDAQFFRDGVTLCEEVGGEALEARGRLGVALDGVHLHLQADGEVVVVEVAVGNRSPQKVSLCFDARLEGVACLGGQRACDEVGQRCHCPLVRKP